jgi:aminopeptidase N
VIRVGLLLFLMLAIIACRGAPVTPAPPVGSDAPTAAPVIASPALEPSPTQEATPTAIATVPASSPTVTHGDAVYAACPLESQQRPLRDEIEPAQAVQRAAICYDLALVLDADGRGYEAAARVTVRNDSASEWPELLFRLYPEAPLLFGGSLMVGEVVVDGVPVDARRALEDDTGLLVPLVAPLAPGETVMVAVDFSAQVAVDLQQGSAVYGIFARTDHAVTLASWFPLLAVWNEEEGDWHRDPVPGHGDAVFSESALMRATLSAPERYELAATGLVIGREEAGDYVTYQVVTGPARDLAVVWLDGYEVQEAQVDGVTVRNWYRAEDHEGAEVAFVAARESVEIFNTHFGPYPFGEVEVVQVPLFGAGGVEYPQLYLLDAGLYGNPQSHEFLALASAHEMAHQWWYSTVGSDINAAPWQDEALTNWSAILWLELSQGEEAARLTLAEWQRRVDVYEVRFGEERIDQSLEDFHGRGGAYGTIVYLKGALFFQALREEIGDEAFFAALRDYYAHHQFGIAAPVELLARFEEMAGRSLQDLYEAWGVGP